jgi:hypothetical protein
MSQEEKGLKLTREVVVNRNSIRFFLASRRTVTMRMRVVIVSDTQVIIPH